MANEQIKYEFIAINKTAAAFNSIKAGLSDITSKINPLNAGLAALGAAITSGALLKFSRDALDAAGGLGELSAQIGASTRSLQGLAMIAVESGVSNEQLQKGLQQLTKRLGEAKVGSESTIKAFQAIGISQRELEGLNTDQAMLKIADALSGITDQSKRAAAEVALFGRAGQQLDPILSQGSEAIRDQIAAMEESGLIMDEYMIAKADEAADKFARLEAELQQRLKIAVVSNADAFITLGNALSFVIEKSGQGLSALTRFAKAGSFLSGKSGAFSVPKLGDILKEMRRSEQFDALNQKFPLTSFGAFAPKASASTFQLSDFLAGGGGSGRGSRSGTSKKKAGGLSEEAKEYLDYLRSIPPQIEAISNEPLINPAMLEQNMKDVNDYLAGIKLPNFLDDSREKLQELSISITSSFENAFMSVVNGTASVKDAFRSMSSAIVSELMRIYVVKKITGFVSNVIDSAFNLDGAKAIGGSVGAGGAYLVGERGPEVFVPNSNGAIIPNNKLGSSGMTFNIDARGAGDPAAVRAMVEQGIVAAAPAIIAAAEARTLSKARRPMLPGVI